MNTEALAVGKVDIGNLTIIPPPETALEMRTLKIGDTVKVLKRKYQSEFEVHVGKVVSFESFQNNPTIVIVYVETKYTKAEVKILYYNSKVAESGNWEVLKADLNDIWSPSKLKKDFLSSMQREIEVKEAEIKEIKEKTKYFLEHFSSTFEDVKELES